MVELLRRLLSLSSAEGVLPLRWKASAVRASQIPQPGLIWSTTVTLATPDDAPEPSAVPSLVAFWTPHGSDDGSRMTGDCHVRFCEGLWLRRWGLLSVWRECRS